MPMFGPVFNSAMKSMAANQYAMSIASNNIANANNPHYTRQRLITQPSIGDRPWGIGTGVDIMGMEALRDRLVEARFRDALSSKFGAETKAGRLSNIETLFNDSQGTGLSQSITDFFNSFQDLAQDPASLAYREQVRVRGSSLVDAIRGKDRELKEIASAANTAVGWNVQQINRLSSEIASVTAQIKQEELHTGAHDLRDRRGALIAELSQYLEVTELDSGDYQLSTSDGRLLVMNDLAVPLDARTITPAIGPGSLRAELETRDTYVPKYLAALDQLAYEISQQVNSIHSTAYDLDGNTGINFFASLSSATGAAEALRLSTEVANSARSIAASRLPAGNDNGAATSIGNLLNAPVFSGGTVMDQYGAMVFAIGSDLAMENANVDQQTALLTQLENRRQSISGVSIDEETLQITQFQRAYEASAQMIRMVDELMQVTLGLVG